MVGYQILRRHILAGGILEESRRTVQSESFLLLATRENNLFRSGLGLRCQFRKQLGGTPQGDTSRMVHKELRVVQAAVQGPRIMGVRLQRVETEPAHFPPGPRFAAVLRGHAGRRREKRI